jgi:hypothetical protein
MDEHLLRYDKSKTFVLIDLETFNLCLNFCHNLPWQIGMIKAKGDFKTDSKNFYINWDTNLKISDDAARITRYDHKKVLKEGLNIKDAFPTIKDWLDHADYIIGHNILGFDIYLIIDLYKSMGCHYEHLINKIIDTNINNVIKIKSNNLIGMSEESNSSVLTYKILQDCSNNIFRVDRELPNLNCERIKTDINQFCQACT